MFPVRMFLQCVACVALITLPNAFAESAKAKKTICEEILEASPNADLQSLSARMIGEELNMDNIREHLEYLTGEKPILLAMKLEDRTHPSNREIARHYIVQALIKMGHKVLYTDFSKGVNVEVEIQGTKAPNEVLHMLAHYDTMVDGGKGADDNGSGVGLLLEMARIFKKYPPAKTVRLVFADLEERGMEGSQVYARRMKEEFFKSDKELVADKTLLGTIVVDTVAWAPTFKEEKPYLVVMEVGEEDEFKPYSYSPPSSGGGYSYGSNSNPVKTAKKKGKKGKKKGEDKSPGLFTAIKDALLGDDNVEEDDGEVEADVVADCPIPVKPKDITHGHEITRSCAKQMAYQFLRFADAENNRREKLRLRIDTFNAKPGTGDHGSFWDKGMPALMVAAAFEKGYVNPHYHKVGDTIPNMNWEYYDYVARWLVESAAYIANTDYFSLAKDLKKEKLATLIASENTAVQVSADHVGKLEITHEEENKAHASDYSSSSTYSSTYGISMTSNEKEAVEDMMEEPAHEVVVCFERNLKKADIIFKNESTYVTSREGIEKIIEAIDKRKITAVVLKKELATMKHDEGQRIWKDIVEGKKKPSKDTFYELLTKLPEIEKPEFDTHSSMGFD